jgi:4-amino-4-deoxy-L-arabinose transferase-like glycosyltransferase
LLRLDQLGHDPLGPAEACISRDWQKPARALEELERREILPPVYRGPLHWWGHLGSSSGMLRFYSTLWALVLVALVFRLGTIYLSPTMGALAALLIAVSPPVVAASHDIGPATQASVLLTLSFACLLRVVFRRASEWHWAIYLLTGALAVACHPLSVWVILVQAILAFIAGPREARQPFYGRLAAHTGLIILFAWVWFRSTRPLYPFFEVDWGAPTEKGLFSLVRLLGVTSVWGTRIYPSGWLWTIASILLIVAPLVYGSMTIRQRQTQDLGGFLLMSAVLPPALILLAPQWLTESHCPATEILTLTVAPLALWAAMCLRTGLRERTRQVLTGLLVLGGLLVTLWSSRVEMFPDWENYRTLLTSPSQAGRVVVASRVARLADFQYYLGSWVKMENLEDALTLASTADKSLLVFEARSPLYRTADAADSPAPLLRAWLEKNCQREDLRRDEFFRLVLWSGFDSVAMRQAVNRATFYDQATSEPMPFVRWFGPYDPGFTRLGATSRVVGSPAKSDLRRVLVAPHAQWIFDPQLPPGYYHVFVSFRVSDALASEEGVLVWTLPDGQRKPQKLARETNGFSFLWEVKRPNEELKMVVFEPGGLWREKPPDKVADAPSLVFYGVGIRQHFPYTVDVGAPFDDLALGGGWHEPQREDSAEKGVGEVTYRWTDVRAQLLFYLPEAGGMIGLEGQLRLRVAQRQSDAPARLKFEVLWDGKELKGDIVATPQWDTVLLALPGAPAPGRHELLIKSPIFRVPDPSDPARQRRLGIMVDKVSIE